MSCRLVNGSRIVSLPGDAGGVRGFSAPTLVLMDEAAYISDELVQTVRPMLAVSNGRFIMMSTPNGRRGAFFHAWSDTTTEGWQREMVTAAECPRIDRTWLETERATVGVWHFSQEYECQFLDFGAQLFSGQHIEAAIIDRPALPIVLANGVRHRANAPRAPMLDAEVTLPGEPVSYVVALDIGQSRDFSALVVAEVRHKIEPAPPDVPGEWEGRTPWGSRLAAMREKTCPTATSCSCRACCSARPIRRWSLTLSGCWRSCRRSQGRAAHLPCGWTAAASGAASRICSRTRGAPRMA